MTPDELMLCLAIGCLLIVFGLVRGLFDRVVEAAIEEVQNFQDSISCGLSLSVPRRTGCGSVRRPISLAGAGALVIVLSVLGYLSN